MMMFIRYISVSSYSCDLYKDDIRHAVLHLNQET